MQAFINGILEADKHVHRKQRHTAHRVWCRIQKELPTVAISESTVRKYMWERKPELGVIGREVFIEQSYDWGVEAQIDWYEARVVHDGVERKVFIFCMRSFHRTYPHASQQAFLEAHELGLRPHQSPGQRTPEVVYRSATGGGSVIVDKFLHRGDEIRSNSKVKTGAAPSKCE